MANYALFIGWGGVVRGREQNALDGLPGDRPSSGRRQQDGPDRRLRAVLLDPHGGELAGFILALGERPQLDRAPR